MMRISVALPAILAAALLAACAAPERRLAETTAGNEATVCNAVAGDAADPLEIALAALVKRDCANLAPAFMASLADAAVVEEADIIDTLRTVPDPDGRLITRRHQGRTQMKVTIWTDAASAGRYYEPGTTNPVRPGAPLIWVTLTPEVRDWCQTALSWPDRTLETQAANALRINQRLGIPPASLKSRFAELWVDLDDGVIRPCADPNPSAQACTLQFPGTVEEPGLTTEGYLRWYGDNINTSFAPTGAPWTRLGYTYDWGPANDNTPPYGASEFMLTPGGQYEVEQVYTLTEYCAD